MSEITDEEYRKIIEDYNNGKIILGVDLAKARQFLCDTGNKSSIIWQIIISFVLPICIIATSIYSFGGWGILYSLIAIIFYWSYMGICSMPLKTKRTIYIISLIGLVVSFFFGFKIALTLVTTFFSFILTYLFYENVKYEIVKKIISEKQFFELMLKLNIINISTGAY